MNVTTQFRIVFVGLFVLTGLVALIGWMVGRDPSQLIGILGIEAGAIGVGEAANVGKRATWKSEAAKS